MDFDIENELKKSGYVRRKVILSGLCESIKEVDELTNKIKNNSFDVDMVLTMLRPKITAEDLISKLNKNNGNLVNMATKLIENMEYKFYS